MKPTHLTHPSPLINQPHHHFSFYSVVSCVFPCFVLVRASVSTGAELFPISSTTTDAGRRDTEVDYVLPQQI